MSTSTIINEEFLHSVEEKTRQALVNGDYNKNSIVNPATVLLLLAELQKARDLQALNVSEVNSYQLGYKDGWADAKATPGADDKPVAWAILVKGEKVVKIYGDPPSEVAPGMHCRPLYLRSQDCGSSAAAKPID